MPVRKKNTVLSIWVLCGVMVIGLVAWFAYLHRSGIELPSWQRLVAEGSSEFWTPANLEAHLKNKGLNFNAVTSRKEDQTRRWILYLFLNDVQDPQAVAAYFDTTGKDSELATYHGVQVEKCLDTRAASTRASVLGDGAFAWGSYVFHGEPGFVEQIRQVLQY